MARILGRTRNKHPDEIFHVPCRIRGLGENTITGATVSVTPAGLVVSIISFEDDRVVVGCDDGADGTDYTVTALATISNGEIRAPMFKQKVEIPT